MRKNLIFLTLLISVLMVSVVSAGITGYLVARGGGIATDGYTATLQKVEGTTAIVSVATPDGETEIVRVEEGKTAQVGEVEISASSLTRGTLFRRGGAEISVIPVEAKSCSCYVYVGANPQEITAEVGQKIYTLDNSGHFTSSYFYGGDEMPTELDISNGLWVQSMNCERLTESLAGSGKQVYNMEQTLNILNDIERPVPFYSKECIGEPTGPLKEHTHLSDYQYKTVNLVKNAQTTPTYNVFAREIDCTKFGKGYIVLGGGYELSPKVPAGYIVEINGPTSKTVYSVELRDYNIQYQNLTGNVFATCARIEPTLHSFGQDY